MCVYLIHTKYVRKYTRIVSRLTKNAGADTNCQRFFIIKINDIEQINNFKNNLKETCPNLET